MRNQDQEKQIVFVEGMNVSTGLGIGSGEKLVYNVNTVCNETTLNTLCIFLFLKVKFKM